ncbi:MAG: DUF1634 domain-containing protein [Chloroflexota bacterium]
MSSAATGSPAWMRRTEGRIGRLLVGVTYVSVGLLVIGVVLMVALGIAPLAGGPPLDLATLGGQLVGPEPAGYLWLGLLAVIAGPIGRVIVAGLAFARDGDRLMAGLALGILAVIATGLVTSVAGTV